MGHRARALHAAVETTLDRRIAGRTLRHGVELLLRRQFGGGLAAKRQHKLLTPTDLRHNSTHQQHGFAHHQPRSGWFDHLQFRAFNAAAEAPFRAIKTNGSAGQPPTHPLLQQRRQFSKILISRRSQFDQFIAVLVGEAVLRPHPAAMAAAVCHLSLGTKADAHAEGWATLTGAQAENIAGQRQRQHRQHAIR